MTKDKARLAIMGAISMALKDPILQQGFEIICKENAELKRVIDNDVDKKIYVQLARKAQLADVQKEQLTKAKELLKRCYDNYIYLQPLRNDIEQFLSEVEK